MDHNALIAAMESNPRYQRAVQRLAVMDPKQKAVLDLVVADKAFAAPLMAREVAALNRAAEMRLAEKKLAASKKAAEKDFSLIREKRDFLSDQGSLAEAVGLTNVIIGGALGHEKMKLNLEQAKQTRDMRNRLIQAMET